MGGVGDRERKECSMTSDRNGTNDIQRQNIAAWKVVRQVVGGLEGVVNIGLVENPDGKHWVIMFPFDLWHWDGRTFFRKANKNKP